MLPPLIIAITSILLVVFEVEYKIIWLWSYCIAAIWLVIGAIALVTSDQNETEKRILEKYKFTEE